ncbi:hypothetical protein TNCV_3330481 [Trichonephila clavipes]|nr:hypothetical protein TNCV_3330481 [Trichonephila clavipes]
MTRIKLTDVAIPEERPSSPNKGLESCAKKTTIDHGPRNFRPQSNDEDDTRVGLIIPKLPHHIKGRESEGELS